MIFHQFTCTIYPYTTSIIDEQEVQAFSATASYSGDCNYWDVGGKAFGIDLVIQDKKKEKMVDLPGIYPITDLSKVVLDNGEIYKVLKVDARPGITFDHTLLTCEITDA